jgi:hypothetical protein
LADCERSGRNSANGVSSRANKETEHPPHDSNRGSNELLCLFARISYSPEIESRPNCLLVRMQKRSELADMKHDRNDTVRVP